MIIQGKMLALAVLLGLPAAGHAEWYEATTPHFIVYSDDTPDHITRYAAKLERFDKAMRLLRGVPDRPIAPSQRVAVYVVHDAQNIENLSGVGVRGFYRPGIEGPAAFVPRVSDNRGKWDLDADSVLRHEYSHHFMFDNYGDIARPIWYVEGFAEFHATAVDQPDGSVIFGTPPTYRASALLDDNSLSIKDVIDADTKKFDLAQINVVYGKGWALVHYLTFEPSRRGQLAKYLEAINAGKTSLQAAEAFGDLKTLDQELGHYVLRPKVSVMTVDAKTLSMAVPKVRKLTAGEAAMMSVRIRSKAGVSATTAPAVFARAQRAAAPYPNDPGAQLTLAEAALDASDYAQASAAADRVIAADSTNEKGYVLRGRALLAQGQAAKVTDKAFWDKARAAFVDANRLDNDDPEALAYFYRVFVAAGKAPTPNARAALNTALELAPEDETLRYEVALDCLANHDNAKARATLTTLAYAPHGGTAARQAADLIAAIDKGDESAITKLTAPTDQPEPKHK